VAATLHTVWMLSVPVCQPVACLLSRPLKLWTYAAKAVAAVKDWSHHRPVLVPVTDTSFPIPKFALEMFPLQMLSADHR
jgi:hypothetical protein